MADVTVNAGVNPAIEAASGASFKITDRILYVPLVTLSKENDTKLLEQLELLEQFFHKILPQSYK